MAKVLGYDTNNQALKMFASGTDNYVITSDGTDANWEQVASGGSSRWTAITAFTRQPASTSTITLTGDQSNTVKVGLPIKYANTTVYYGIITAVSVSTDTTITIAGVALTASANWIDASSLYYGTPEMVVIETFTIPGYFEDATDSTLLYNDLLMRYRWSRSKAYIVQYRCNQTSVDTGETEAAVNIYTIVNGTSTAATNGGGMFLNPDATLWNSTIVIMNPTNYILNRDTDIEIGVTKGSNGDAYNLTVHIVIVLE